MTPFNPNAKTFGEVLGPAMSITEQADADQYLAAYIKMVQEDLDHRNVKGRSAEEIAKHNLGYFAGYYSDDTRERVERLFKCSHPVFGSIAANGSPTPAQAFAVGKARGSKK